MSGTAICCADPRFLCGDTQHATLEKQTNKDLRNRHPGVRPEATSMEAVRLKLNSCRADVAEAQGMCFQQFVSVEDQAHHREPRLPHPTSVSPPPLTTAPNLEIKCGACQRGKQSKCKVWSCKEPLQKRTGPSKEGSGQPFQGREAASERSSARGAALEEHWEKKAALAVSWINSFAKWGFSYIGLEFFFRKQVKSPK